jgi:hypothetical protein
MLRRNKPLKSRSGFKKPNKTIRRVSKRREDVNKLYGKIRKEYLWDKNYTCEICGGQATDIHHKKGRGKHLLAKDTFMACCRQCHQRIHDNPGWARENGYLIYEFK